MPFHQPLAPKSTPQHRGQDLVPTVAGSLPKQRVRHSDEEWDKLKPIVTRLFIREDKTVPQVLADLNQSHGFQTSLRVLKERLSQWGLGKNLKQSEMKILLAKRNSRSSAGKDTVFYHRGQELSDARLIRAGNRPCIRDETPPSPGAPTPAGVEYHTPPMDVVCWGIEQLSNCAPSNEGVASPSQASHPPTRKRGLSVAEDDCLGPASKNRRKSREDAHSVEFGPNHPGHTRDTTEDVIFNQLSASDIPVVDE